MIIGSVPDPEDPGNASTFEQAPEGGGVPSELRPDASNLSNGGRALNRFWETTARVGLRRVRAPSVRRAGVDVAKEVEDCPLGEVVDSALETSLARVRRQLKAFPETRIAARNSAVSRRLVRRLMIDSLGRQVHNYTAYKNPKGKWHVTAIDQRDNVNRGLDPIAIHQLELWYANDHAPDKAARMARHRRALEGAREQMLTTHEFVYTEDVAKILTSERLPPAPGDIAVLRRWGALLAVSDHGRWLYPMFQFDPQTGSVSDLVLEANLVVPHDDEWDMFIWWSGGRTALNGKSYADIVHTKRGIRVISDVLAAENSSRLSDSLG